MCAWELSTALFTVARDGSGLRQLTANTLHEFSPQVLPDGRILDHARLTERGYRDPFPIARDRFLVAYGGGQKAVEPRFRIYLLAADDRRALVWEDGEASCTWPLPLTPRPRPPVLSDQPWPAGETTAVLLLQNVYAGLGPQVVPGEVRWLRVMEQIPKFPVNETEDGRWRIYEMNPVMGQRCYYARRCLG